MNGYITRLGAKDAQIDADLVFDGAVSRFEITVSDEQLAGEAARWLSAGLVSAAREYEVLRQVQAYSRGKKLFVETPPSEEIPSAIKATLLEAFSMPSAGMVPTLHIGDHFYAAKGNLAGRARVGDVVVFRAPDEPSKLWVKRVVAVGGDKVVIKGRALVLNGRVVAARQLDDSYEWSDFDPLANQWVRQRGALWAEVLDEREHQILRTQSGDRDGEWDVPEGHVFVLGDNRDNSQDSRHFGAVPREAIVGRATVIWWSMGANGVRWDRIGRVVQ